MEEITNTSASAPRKPHEEVASALAALIADRNLQPGDRLPTEAELCRQFGVSRTLIREAVKVLQTLGMVTARRGSGHYVQRRPSAVITEVIDYSLALEPESLFSLFEFRRLLEVDSAGLAAERITPRALALLRDALAKNMAAAESGDTVLFYQFDRMIHQRIAEAAGNTFLLSTIQAVDSLVGAASRAAAGIIGSHTEAAEQHRAIVAAIGVGDVAQAQAAMELHINTFIHNYRRLVAKRMLPQDAAEVAG